jgi:hypothetical protein
MPWYAKSRILFEGKILLGPPEGMFMIYVFTIMIGFLCIYGVQVY